jgi:hypothetical protein
MSDFPFEMPIWVKYLDDLDNGILHSRSKILLDMLKHCLGAGQT